MSWQELAYLRNNRLFIDIKLLVGSEIIHAHKIVLAASSAYFKVNFIISSFKLTLFIVYTLK